MKKDKKSLAAIVGASIVTSLTAGVVNAAENPFALKDLDNGYTHVAEAAADQAKAKESKCGAEVMKKNPEMKCGAEMMKMDAPAADKKAIESKCAGMKMDKAPATPATPATPSTPAK
ncbi:MAG: hypothetical protein PHE55_08010 [Methylococcaceae bacterium]|nr:hypothetical protein [Methylococcaceae bacterium]